MSVTTTTTDIQAAAQAVGRSAWKQPHITFGKTEPQFLNSFDGEPIDSTKFLKTWRIKGRLDEIWQRLHPYLVGLLKKKQNDPRLNKEQERGCDDPGLELRCYLVGNNSERAGPRIAVVCKYRWYGCAVRDIIIESKILRCGQYRCIRGIGVACADLYTPAWAKLPSHHSAVSIRSNAVVDSHASAIQYQCEATGRVATIAGLVRVGQQTLGLTVAHAFCPTIEQADLATQEYEVFPAHSSPEPSNDASEFWSDVVSLGSEIPSSDESLSLLDDEDESTAAVHEKLVGMTAVDHDPTMRSFVDETMMRIGGLYEFSRKSDHDSDAMEHDWALVTLNAKTVSSLGGDCAYSTMTNKAVQDISFEIPKKSIQLTLCTARGTFTGFSTCSETPIRLPHTKIFQPVWPMVFEDIQMGDCGSLVYDLPSGHLMGMLIAASHALGEAYILPAHFILDDVRMQSRQSASILPRHMNFGEGTSNTMAILDTCSGMESQPLQPTNDQTQTNHATQISKIKGNRADPEPNFLHEVPYNFCPDSITSKHNKLAVEQPVASDSMSMPFIRLLSYDSNHQPSFQSFSSHQTPPYAILSHCWGRGEYDEITYTDILHGTGKDKLGYKKLTFCGAQAQSDNLQYFWIDTCCINKSDHAEVSNAINSMFRWYKEAQICYVYLSDTSTRDDRSDINKSIAERREGLYQSKWFTRGWTLQELLAPRSLTFFSEDGVSLGSKQSLEYELQCATGIPLEALRGERLKNFSIEQRFAWAQGRQTSRAEDQAYCLLGLFEVNLPVAYGEGYWEARKRLERSLHTTKFGDRQVLDWLSPLDFAAQQHDIIRRVIRPACEWFFRSKHYHTWSSGRPESLWLTGLPGAGKTVLSAVVVEQQQSQPRYDNAIVVYAFCSIAQTASQSAIGILGAMLKQLAFDRYDILQVVRGLHDYHFGRGTTPSLDEITRSLLPSLALYDKVIIVIDGLDELSTDNDQMGLLLRTILELRRSLNANVLLTSRPVIDPSEILGPMPKVEVKAPDHDIQRYVTEQIASMARCVHNNSQIQDEIRQTIVHRAGGMFLFAQLLIESLRHKTTLRKVRTALRQLETIGTVDQMYDGVLRRIDQQGVEDRQLALRVLSWLTYAQRPLRVNELLHAVAVDPIEHRLDREDIPTLEDIVEACAGLVTVDYNCDTVHLIHYTARQYFMRETSRQWFLGAQKDIASSCLAYLCSNTFESGSCQSDFDFMRRSAEHSLFNYSAQYWGTHCQPVQQEVDRKLINKFFGNPLLLAASSQALFVNTRYMHKWNWTQGFPGNASPLHMASHFNLTHIVDILLAQGDLVDSTDSYGQTALHWAISLSTASSHPCVDSHDSLSHRQGFQDVWTSSSSSMKHDHVAMVQLLLNNGKAGVNVKDKSGCSPLGWAAKNGRTEATKLLITRIDVDIDTKDKFGRTPLAWASKNGHDSTVAILLTSDKSDPNARDHTYGRTALHWAARNGHLAVLHHLLAAGNLDMGIRDDTGRTAIELAVAHGRITAITLLMRGMPLSIFYDMSARYWKAVKGSTVNVHLRLA